MAFFLYLYLLISIKNLKKFRNRTSIGSLKRRKHTKGHMRTIYKPTPVLVYCCKNGVIYFFRKIGILYFFKIKITKKGSPHNILFALLSYVSLRKGQKLMMIHKIERSKKYELEKIARIFRSKMTYF